MLPKALCNLVSVYDNKFIVPELHQIYKLYQFCRHLEKEKSLKKLLLWFVFTSSDVNRTSLGKPESPFSFISGQNLYLAKFMAYILETEPPAERGIQISC